ncbi:MAG: peptidoglycan/xylan/chitin deacetylase (PgdA/CDA1 family) [Glaciecola sp.]|jgi:peptidoglycan/xylan/chitin deacetylase (PgdA/CDA1 family)
MPTSVNYFYKSRWWMKLFSPHLIWRIATREKEVFLTFDDGPSDPITTKVLSLLKEFDAKATFFCIGKNVGYNPALFSAIVNEGHLIGNHTFHHINGWKCSGERYVASINRCETIFGSSFFRPPFGKITWKQIRHIKHRFKIVMWTILSGDFDKSLNTADILADLKLNVKKGDIIVFHDNAKTADRLLEILPQFLAFLKQEGYKCSVIREPKKWYHFNSKP